MTSKEIKLEKLLESFNVTIDEYNTITEKFYNEKLDEINDTILICISINLLYELRFIQLQLIRIYSSEKLFNNLKQDFITLTQLIIILIDIAHIPSVTNNIKQSVINIKNWIQFAIKTAKDLESEDSEVTIVYKITDSIFRTRLLLEQIINNVPSNIEEPTTLLQ